MICSLGNSFFWYCSSNSTDSGDSDKWKALYTDLNKKDALFLSVVVSRMLLHNASGFERRVVRPLEKYPYKLLWLAYSPMDQSCPKRAALARELLQTDVKRLEVNAAKIKNRFQAMLVATSTTGKVHPRLYWLFRSICITWKSDVRECERVNKMLKLQEEHAPRIRSDLRSSRIGIKYKLGSAGVGVTKTSKWSKVRPVVEQVREECLASYPDIVDIMADPCRWAPSARPSGLETPATINKAYMRLKPELNTMTVEHAWAASYNMLAHKTLATMIIDSSFLKTDDDHLASGLCPVAFCIRSKAFNESKYTNTFWVSAGLVRKKHLLCPARLQGKSLVWSSLSNFRLLLDILKEMYSKVRDGMEVKILRVFLLFSKAASTSGEVNTFRVASMVHLLDIQKPSPNFLKKLHALDSEHHDTNAAKDVDAAAPNNVKGQNLEEDLQEHGLNLLVEEAEAQCCGENDSDDGEESVDAAGGGVDTADFDRDDYDFQQLMQKGINAAFSNNDDEQLEAEAYSKLAEPVEQNATEEHEHSIATAMITSGQCDIDSPEAQQTIHHLQELGLDPVEAAMETAYATASGTCAVDNDNAGQSVAIDSLVGGFVLFLFAKLTQVLLFCVCCVSQRRIEQYLVGLAAWPAMHCSNTVQAAYFFQI